MKIIIKYGVIAAVLLVLWDLLMYNYLFETIGSVSVLVQAIIIGGALFAGIRELKFKQYNGEITYKNASVNGFLITFTAGFLYAAALFNLYPYGNNNFQAQVKQKTLEGLAVQKAPQKVVADTLAALEKLITPEAMGKAALINTLIIGIVFTLILSSILRKKDQSDQA